MKKLNIIIAVSCFALLVLSASLIVPIRAQTSQPVSSQATPAISLNVQKISSTKALLQYGDENVIAEQLSANHTRLTITANNKTDIYDYVKTTIAHQFNGTTVLENSKTVYLNGANVSTTPIYEAQQSVASVAKSGVLPLMQMSDYIYSWDNVRFTNGVNTHYPIPDKVWYGIPKDSNWNYQGNLLTHSQINYLESQLLGVVPEVVGAAIGALVGAYFSHNPYIAVVGAVAGAVITAVLIYAFDWITLDNDGCMWYWISNAFGSWLGQNELEIFLLGSAAFGWVLTEFWAEGFLRVGNINFADNVGAGSPGTGYMTSASGTPIGYGGANNANGLTGYKNDGSYAQLYGGNYGDGAVMTGSLNQQEYAGSHIYVWGYSAAGYYSHLYAYVSNDNYNWYQVSNQILWDNSQPNYIDCGISNYNFRYIAFAGYDDNGLSCMVYIDSVAVSPN